ncbi:MAG: hypothetical protein U0637_09840 [Phycisphaerales bacterium]
MRVIPTSRWTREPAQPMHHAMRTRTARLATALLASTMLTACMTRPASRVHYMGPDFSGATAARPAHPDGRLRLASLGAGDPLGRSVYQNDVYLAYLSEVAAPLRVTGVSDAP